ncbi:DUF1120 domain-containing protein [Sphingopyxis sp. MWB1]|uniref:DUF1120 domain-containing protein n=1 Tax=Sphingopyxis sp. MWB1 TaxID=1537715 RepID=UPI00051A4EA8|nr:DUF1120 domain-containing protein [Sphingopyxis sp. MWB1]
MRFNSKISGLALAVAAVAASGAAHAQSIDVRVIGTITPAACAPNMSGGGVIDYGNIAASSLNQTDYTALPERLVPFSLTCDAPTKVAVRAVDNRASTIVPGIIESGILGGGMAAGYGYDFGLGASSGQNVGIYVVALRGGSFTGDGNAVDSLHSNDDGASWNGNSSGTFRRDRLVSWAAPGTTTPGSYSTLAGELRVQAAIDKAENLDLTDEVPLDGLATLEVVYL